MLKEFGSSVPTTWNLNRQCIESFKDTDEVLQRVLSIWRCQAEGKTARP